MVVVTPVRECVTTPSPVSASMLSLSRPHAHPHTHLPHHHPPPPASERLAARFGVTRKEQDEFAVRSHHLAAKAHKDGLLAAEIVPVNGNKDDNGFRTWRE